MTRTRLGIALSLSLIAALVATLRPGPVRAEEERDEGREEARFEVTVTNLTRGQRFTPILVASHRAGVSLFTLGKPASHELEQLAEEGDVKPLTAQLSASRDVLEVINNGKLLDPGQSSSQIVRTRDGFNHLIVAAMLIPTNDGFFALNGVRGPRGDETITLYSPAYDSGTEVNDEKCASIPGPFFKECGGPGGGADVIGGAEGFVHIHAGIHGIGDLAASLRDWRNPVAQITIRRIKG